MNYESQFKTTTKIIDATMKYLNIDNDMIVSDYEFIISS